MTAYQKHSETSKAAAESVDAETQRKEVFALIERQECSGVTNDEISAKNNKTGSYYSPRLIELERAGKIVKTGMQRETRSGKMANVYVATQYYKGYMGSGTAKQVETREEFKQAIAGLARYLKGNIKDGSLKRDLKFHENHIKTINKIIEAADK